MFELLTADIYKAHDALDRAMVALYNLEWGTLDHLRSSSV